MRLPPILARAMDRLTMREHFGKHLKVDLRPKFNAARRSRLPPFGLSFAKQWVDPRTHW
jgi:hypothetical protein